MIGTIVMEHKKEPFSRQKDNPGSVVNTDNDALRAYKKRKQRENEINTIKNEVNEIKLLLQQLIEKNNV